jgi:hypothetical protein
VPLVLVAAVGAVPWWTPKIHYAPPCYTELSKSGRAGPHDIAAGITLNGTTHLFPGCWSQVGGLQHVITRDFVNWELKQAVRGVKTSGGLAVDEDNVPLLIDVGSSTKTEMHARMRRANASGLMDFADPEYVFIDWSLQGGPGDPIRPWRGSDNRWYTALAISACNDSHVDHNASYSWDCGAGAVERLWSTDELRLSGSGKWCYEGELLRTNRSLLPWRPMQFEYVTPDFFGGLPGDTRPYGGGKETKVFFSSVSTIIDAKGECTNNQARAVPPAPTTKMRLLCATSLIQARLRTHVCGAPGYRERADDSGRAHLHAPRLWRHGAGQR